jgi:hypothetical protein
MSTVVIVLYIYTMFPKDKKRAIPLKSRVSTITVCSRMDVFIFVGEWGGDAQIRQNLGIEFLMAVAYFNTYTTHSRKCKHEIFVWTGFRWVRIGPGGSFLSRRQRTFVVEIKSEKNWSVEGLSDCQQGSCSRELITSRLWNALIVLLS